MTEKIEKSKYAIYLMDGKVYKGTYRVEKELFDSIQKILEPYRSVKVMPKPVKCIETGSVFKTQDSQTIG